MQPHSEWIVVSDDFTANEVRRTSPPSKSIPKETKIKIVKAVAEPNERVYFVPLDATGHWSSTEKYWTLKTHFTHANDTGQIKRLSA